MGDRVRRLDGVWTVYRVTPCAAYISRRGEPRTVRVWDKRLGAERVFEAQASESLSVSLQCLDSLLVSGEEES